MGKFEELYESLLKEKGGTSFEFIGKIKHNDKKKHLDKMLAQYLKTALWSSTNDEEPLDKDYGVNDITNDAKKKSEKDCKKFLDEFEKELEKYNKKNKYEKNTDEHQSLFDFDIGQLGHDFWLTRNGHGAGFFDGDYDKDIEDILMKITKKFDEVNPYVTDDDKIDIQ